MNDELKQLIEDAAKLLGIDCEVEQFSNGRVFATNKYNEIVLDPLDSERGDLWKVAEAAELDVDFDVCAVFKGYNDGEGLRFVKGDYQSQALAVLRAASAVLKTREGE